MLVLCNSCTDMNFCKLWLCFKTFNDVATATAYFPKSCWWCCGVSPVRPLDSCAAVHSAWQLLYTSGQYGGCSLAARSATCTSTTCQPRPHASNSSSGQDGFWCQAAHCLVSRYSSKQLSPPCCTLQFHCQGWKVGTTYLT